MSKPNKSPRKARGHVEETRRPETPELEGITPLPEELTGRASGTSEDVATLFSNDAGDHFADGFRGGSNADPGSDLLKESDTDPDADEDVTAV